VLNMEGSGSNLFVDDISGDVSSLLVLRPNQVKVYDVVGLLNAIPYRCTVTCCSDVCFTFFCLAVK